MNADAKNALCGDILDFIDVTGQTTKAAADRIEKYADAEKRAMDFAPEILGKLLHVQLVRENTKAAAAEMLSDHTGTLELFSTLIDRYAAAKQSNEKTASVLGRGRPDESRAARQDYALGSRPVGDEKRASDLAFERIMQPAGSY